jgi:hypothetical protein
MTDSTWLTPAAVIQWQEDQAVPEPVTDRPSLQTACNAVASYVEEIHPEEWVYDELDPTLPPVYTPRPSYVLGAIMFAARLAARGGTILGVQGYAELGGSPILRTDPDIARLLKIGGFRAFAFGAPTPPTTTTEVGVWWP